MNPTYFYGGTAYPTVQIDGAGVIYISDDYNGLDIGLYVFTR